MPWALALDRNLDPLPSTRSHVSRGVASSSSFALRCTLSTESGLIPIRSSTQARIPVSSPREMAAFAGCQKSCHSEELRNSAKGLASSRSRLTSWGCCCTHCSRAFCLRSSLPCSIESDSILIHCRALYAANTLLEVRLGRPRSKPRWGLLTASVPEGLTQAYGGLSEQAWQIPSLPATPSMLSHPAAGITRTTYN
jgi:hypothetical protein